MADWRRERLGDHAQIGARIGWRGLSADEYVDSGPFLIAGKHIVSGSVDWAGCDHLTEDRYRESPEIALQIGDVIISKDGTIGRVARIDSLPGPATLNGTMMLVRPTGSLNHRYLSHLLNSSAFKKLVEERVSGSSVPHLFQRDLTTLPVSLPPLEEQRQIAEILDTIDETIRATERIIAKLIDVEQGLRRDLLDRRFEGARSEWKRCRIGDFADVQRGASPRPIDNPAWFAPDGPGWIRISDVTAAGDLLLRTRDHLSPAGVARSRRTFPGDVIISIAATIGVAIVVGIEACYHDGFVRIDHDGSVIPEFLVMLLAHHKQDFVRSGQTGTQANINSTIVAATEVALPGLEVQSEIVSATSAARGSIRVEKESRRALQETREGLASDLLSGRLRTVAA